MAYQGSTEAGAGGRRRDLRKGQPERQAADQLAVRRRGSGWRFRRRPRRHRWVISRSSSTSCPAPDPALAMPTTRMYPFGFGLSYTTFEHTGLSVSPTVSATARDGAVHRHEHRFGGRHGHRPGVRETTGQRQGDAAAAPGRVHPRSGQGRQVQDGGLRFKASALGETRVTSTLPGRRRCSRGLCSCRSTRTPRRPTTSTCRRRSPSTDRRRGIAASTRAWRSPPKFFRETRLRV